MTQQEIQERNEQIALMLGLIPLKKPYLEAYTVDTNTYNVSFYHDRMEGESWYLYLQYDSDWNWLMEAVEFIENLDLNDIFTMPEFNYYVGKMTLVRVNKDVLKKMPITSKKEAVFIAVSDFAKLYNNKEL